MRQIFAFILILFFNFSFGQTTFFDENDKEISENEFNKKLKGSIFPAFNESLKTAKIIINRTEKGETDSYKINSLLSKDLNVNLKLNRPAIIVFYPGKDLCNSSGVSTPESSFNWYKQMEKGAKKIKSSNFFYVFKNNEDLKTINKLPWRKDPDNIIESTFFKYHYPCSSYVIIYNNKYISYFGEFMMNQVWTDLKEIIE